MRSVAAYELRCIGLVLNSTEMASDIAGLTNADILKQILNVPLLAGLGENLTELPVDWRLMLDSTRGHQRLELIQDCKENEHNSPRSALVSLRAKQWHRYCLD